MPLSFDKVIDKQLTYFFESHSIQRYLAKPHNLVWDLLKVHRSLESSDMIKRVTHSII